MQKLSRLVCSWLALGIVTIGILLNIHAGLGQNYYLPSEFGDNGECGVTALTQLSPWTFAEIPSKMPTCRSFFFYLSHGRYHSFPGGYFSSQGHLQHFFFELTNITFAYFPNSDESDSPFQDVVFDISLYFEIVEVTATVGWNWNQLRYPKPAKGGTVEYESYRSTYGHLDRNFSNIFDGAVTAVRIHDSVLRTLDDYVFAGFHGLQECYIINSQLTEVKRNNFPKPALALEKLLLRENKLQSLPRDLFLDMPNLARVSLSGNPLKVLEESTFRDAIGAFTFELKNLQINCDCRMRWMKYLTVTSDLEAIHCASPVGLQGRKLVDVPDNEFEC